MKRVPLHSLSLILPRLLLVHLLLLRGSMIGRLLVIAGISELPGKSMKPLGWMIVATEDDDDRRE